MYEMYCVLSHSELQFLECLLGCVSGWLLFLAPLPLRPTLRACVYMCVCAAACMLTHSHKQPHHHTRFLAQDTCDGTPLSFQGLHAPPTDGRGGCYQPGCPTWRNRNTFYVHPHCSFRLVCPDALELTGALPQSHHS